MKAEVLKYMHRRQYGDDHEKGPSILCWCLKKKKNNCKMDHPQQCQLVLKKKIILWGFSLHYDSIILLELYYKFYFD